MSPDRILSRTWGDLQKRIDGRNRSLDSRNLSAVVHRGDAVGKVRVSKGNTRELPVGEAVETDSGDHSGFKARVGELHLEFVRCAQAEVLSEVGARASCRSEKAFDEYGHCRDVCDGLFDHGKSPRSRSSCVGWRSRPPRSRAVAGMLDEGAGRASKPGAGIESSDRVSGCALGKVRRGGRVPGPGHSTESHRGGPPQGFRNNGQVYWDRNPPRSVKRMCVPTRVSGRSAQAWPAQCYRAVPQ